MRKMSLRLNGPRSFEFEGKTFAVPAIVPVQVIEEVYDQLPPYQERDGWTNGVVLKQLVAVECSLADALQPDSVVVASGGGLRLERGVDYQFDNRWAAIGRLENGRIGAETPVVISYTYQPMRLDSVARTAAGELIYLVGTPASSCPKAPTLPAGAERLMNVYQDATTPELTAANLFPILIDALIVPAATEQQHCIPKTMAKLRNGEKLRILAWGDSVTEASYLPEEERWQTQFVARLRARYPQADIELVSNGWGGRAIPNFLEAPADSPYNFAAKVLGVNPDLVVSEFVNDGSLKPEVRDQVYPFVLEEFRKRGFEWIALTPHYVRPDWMGFSGQNGEAIDEDPRPYVTFLRDFTRANGVGLAEAARLYGQLWRRGVPYNTLMTNNINHPDRDGMAIFADALMAIF